MTVNADATGGTSTRSVSGTGTTSTPDPTRVIALSGNLAFGNVSPGSTGTATLTISNDGNAAVTVTVITYPTGFTGNWGSGTIAAGGAQDVTVTFTPTAATLYGGTVTVDADATSGTNTTTVSGTGATSTPPPTRVIAMSGNLAFGDVETNTTATATLTISNNGNAPLTVTVITYPTGFTGNWERVTIAAGGVQHVTVTFAPTAATSYGGTVTVDADATSGINTITVSGTGVATAPDSTPPTFVSASFSPDTVNVSAGAAGVTK